MPVTTGTLDMSNLVREGPDSDINMAWYSETTTLNPIDPGVAYRRTTTNMVGGPTHGKAQTTNQWMVCSHKPPEHGVSSVLSM